MNKFNQPKKVIPKKTTRFVGKTKMTIKNEETLKIIGAFKGCLDKIIRY